MISQDTAELLISAGITLFVYIMRRDIKQLKKRS